MIKVENFGKAVRITGSVEQIAMEFESLARGVRNAFCDTFGKEDGSDLYWTVLHYAEMDEDERDRCAKAALDRAKEENPELFRKFEEKMAAGGTGSGRAEVHTEK